MRGALPPCSASPANSVHIILDGEGEGVVDDIVDPGDVEASRCNVSRDKQRHLLKDDHASSQYHARGLTCPDLNSSTA